METSRMSKRVIALVLILLAMVMSYGVALPAKAEILQSVHTPYVIIDLNFENGKAFCSSYIKSEDNNSYISGNLVLSKMTDTGAQAVKTWSFSSRSKILDVVKSTAVTRGKYRLVLSATVTSNGKRDPIMRTVYANY